MAGFDALVLAGGGARRLSGADKPGLDLAGSSLLEHVLSACAGASRVVVVGPRRRVAVDVHWTRESPPGAGPVAAVAAGLPCTAAPLVVLLGADLPWIAPAMPLLRAAVADDLDAAVLVDESGRRNLLAAAWRRRALQDALSRVGEPAGAAMRALYADARIAEVPDAGGWGQDCDTWDDLARARERAQP
jgi:molybdopterin-guanine dinucleotide biosynthesis protein A